MFDEVQLCCMCKINEARHIVDCYTCQSIHAICDPCLKEYKQKRGLVDVGRFKKNEYHPDFQESAK